MRTRSRSRGHIAGTDKKPDKRTETTGTQVPKKLLTIYTSGDLEHQLNKKGIPLIDTEDILEDIEDAEDEIENSEELEGMDDDNESLEDEDVDYDETIENDPFDIEERHKSRKAIYVVEVTISNDTPSIQFLQAPLALTTDISIENTLAARNKVFREMASFIAKSQKGFFLSPQMGNIINLNQKDLLIDMNGKGYKLAKEHISRMLDSLFFKIKGMGILPGKLLFKHYGHVTGLSKDDKLVLEYLSTCSKGLSQLEKAKELWEFIREKRGIEIKLTDNPNESDRYRTLTNMIRDAEGKTNG